MRRECEETRGGGKKCPNWTRVPVYRGVYVLHGRRTNVRPRRNTRVHAGPLPRTAVAALGSARKRKKCGFSGTGEVPPCAPAAVVWPVRFSRAALCTARGTASAHSRTAHSPLSYEPPLVRNPPTSPPVVSGPARQTLMAPWPYPSVRAPPGPAHPHGRAGDGHGVASLACTHGRTCTDPHGGACTCPPSFARV